MYNFEVIISFENRNKIMIELNNYYSTKQIAQRRTSNPREMKV